MLGLMRTVGILHGYILVFQTRLQQASYFNISRQFQVMASIRIFYVLIVVLRLQYVQRLIMVYHGLPSQTVYSRRSISTAPVLVMLELSHGGVDLNKQLFLDGE
jgi:hypothetical protein